MTVILYDGSTLTCAGIEIGIDGILCDGIRFIPFREVLRIMAN